MQSKKTEGLRKKKVLLFFSDFDISEKVVSILKPICEEESRKDQYEIVWIPIVKNWIDIVQSKCKVNEKYFWYVVRQFSSVLGIKYVKEQWGFKDKPIVVVLSSEAKVEHKDAFHMIQTWGIEAYPFTFERERELRNREDWFGSTIDFNPDVLTWIQEGKYIFIYGGVDEEWRKQFAKRVEALAKDYVIQYAKISIVLSCVEMGCKGKDDRLQKFLSSRTHKNTESGWVVLSKGSKLVDGGNGITILKVLEEFNKWRRRVREGTMFEICFKDYHNEVLHNGEDWFGYFMIEHFQQPKFSTWIQEGKHIFIYGGEDEEWINHFTKKSEALTKDPVIQKAMISIELHHLTMKSKGKYDNGIAGHFWYKLELFSNDKPCTAVRQEIEKLISYKNENFGWAVLCKGYKLMASGNETNILKVLELEEFKKYI
ncbi:protein SIEVE ELEMENT OCCLUSION B-like [Castanea sativa]|uniref:protein SIEVE ELEMENT OCCLUSION B-like n=1 Tax=Castanea sativa TaxID=21020 RepID=UPI003F64C3DE